ncbi:hypothetical protein DDB_G0274583 [Dictyostelium discoideum AX4]|uniref:Uncharacterized protein n=1 Tax=Dictyostelium discoideum TaxID=44689 RepID=Q86IX5_DICDI|nr:hypothetical protein DDB_G0274583 [Dictyostelium discoideum AX4]EAL70184.1 hypothetical protein DDB_G0274583 [Dictyostelium discoideum AX4]|eukprot:XP_643913.1 hypothetical protein DDB_G0274583 [Dictyostelium discoideum AX4]
MNKSERIIKNRKDELEAIDNSLAAINSLSLYVEKMEEDYESIGANYLVLTHLLKKEIQEMQNSSNKSNNSTDDNNNNNNNDNNNHNMVLKN